MPSANGNGRPAGQSGAEAMAGYAEEAEVKNQAAREACSRWSGRASDRGHGRGDLLRGGRGAALGLDPVRFSPGPKPEAVK